MHHRRRMTAAVAAGVISLGAVLVGCTSSDTTSQGAPGEGTGRGAPGAQDTSKLVAALVSQLSVTEEAATTAVEEAMAAGRPGKGEGSAPPSDSPQEGTPGGERSSGDPQGSSDGGGRTEQIATAIAEALSVSLDRVQPIVEEHLPQRGGRPQASASASPTATR